MLTEQQLAIKDIQTLPWIGEKSANRLYAIGIRKATDLKGAQPETIFSQLQKNNPTLNIVMLYVLRCAVYAVTQPHPQQHLLKWWNWKQSR